MDNEPLTLEDKHEFNAFFETEAGKRFIQEIKLMHDDHLNSAQVMYLKVVNPNEQISVQVNHAAGIKEILDFIETVQREIKEDKEESQPSEE